MLEFLIFSIFLIALGIASYLDLKTTEVPDKFFYILLILLLPFLVLKYLQDFNFFKNSLMFGGLYLLIGLILYKTGQWGGADSFFLTLIGFCFPSLSFSKASLPFPLAFFINLMFIGAIYMLIYSFFLTYNKKFFWRKFRVEIQKNLKMWCYLSLTLFFLTFCLFFQVFSLLPALQLSLSLTLLFFTSLSLLKYAKLVENLIFKRKIPVSKLKAGDMLAEIRELRGLTEAEVKRIKKTRKYVWVKEGIRFLPAFPLTLLFTVFCGDFFQFLLFFSQVQTFFLRPYLS